MLVQPFSKHLEAEEAWDSKRGAAKLDPCGLLNDATTPGEGTRGSAVYRFGVVDVAGKAYEVTGSAAPRSACVTSATSSAASWLAAVTRVRSYWDLRSLSYSLGL